MSNDAGITVMSAVELALTASLAALFYLRGWHRQFKAMGLYLVVRVFTCALLLPLLMHSLPISEAEGTTAYAYIWWSFYALSYLLLFYICVEIIRSIFEPYPDLAHYGVIGLRWLFALFTIITVASLTTVLGSAHLLPDLGYALMRSASVMVLCLLAFMCIGMKVLRISARDISFGLALGFGVLTLNDLIHTVLIHSRMPHTTLQYICGWCTLSALCTWVGYAAFALRKRAQEPKLLPFRTMLYRWNEIAAAIGHKETQVVQQPSPRFFLSDVEKIVDRAFENTFKEPTPEKKS